MNPKNAASAVGRLDAAAIEQLFGDDAAYLKRKQVGGENGFKGTRFELLFGVHRIAQLAQRLIERNEDFAIEWQSIGFVDDWCVRRDEAAAIAAYQLKNTAAVSWLGGKHALASDFKLQHTLSSAEGYSSIDLTLVCSNEEIVDELRASIPEDIRAFSSAQYFPYAEKFLPLVQDHAWMAHDFGYLAKVERPTKIEVEQILQVLMGAWECAAPSATLREVLKSAQAASPQLLRTMENDEAARARLADDVRVLLDGIRDFQYGIIRGFLRWSGMKGSTSGVLSFDCFSERFAQWQVRIRDLKPQVFEDIEGELQ